MNGIAFLHHFGCPMKVFKSSKSILLFARKKEVLLLFKRFIRGGFRGLLPKKFARGPGATSLIPTGMNSKNVEERSRYVDVSVCDYLVEEEGNSDGKGKIFASVSLLDDVATPTLSRAFVIPFVTRVTWKKYQVRKLN